MKKILGATDFSEPAAQALAQADTRGAELLVITGSQNRRGARRWLLGSTAEAVVRHAPCSVLVARS